MSEPRTLLQMAGADLSPSSLSDAAVVLIDCQNEYVKGPLALPGVGPALDQVARLLERARAAGAPIIHIQHHGKPGGAFDVEDERGWFAPQAAPDGGERVVRKALPNAFADTVLQDALAETGRKQVILGGFMTHMCVSSTARAALDLGYRCTLVAGATATRDLPNPSGGVVSADALQAASLSALADRFAIVVETPEDVPE